MSLRPKSAALWPCWLLVAAWICANVPATATFRSSSWLKGAGHFSHTEELRQSVAALLAGPSGKIPPPVASAPATPPDSAPPALPAGTGGKKLDLTLLTGPFRVIAFQPPVLRPDLMLRAPAAPVAEVPHPPPRGNPAT